MDLADEPQRKRQRFEALKAVVHGRNVVDDLRHVVGESRAGTVELECQDIVEAALRTLNLRAENSLAANVHGDEEIGVREGATHAVQPADRLIGVGQQGDQRPELQRRVGRERRRDERAVAGQLVDVPAGPRR